MARTGMRRPTWPSAALLLAVLLPIFAWAHLAYPGYFELHSGLRPILNLQDLAAHLTDFSWAPLAGQPHDLLRGDRVLAYLLGMAPYALGASPAVAVKWVFGTGLVAASVGMFLWARRRLGAWPALLAAMVYGYWPIGLATTYVRGAIAEAVLLALLPWILWAADAAVSGSRRAAVGLAIGMAALLWTQIGLALWFAAAVLAYVVVVGRARLDSGEGRNDDAGLRGHGGGLEGGRPTVRTVRTEVLTTRVNGAEVRDARVEEVEGLSTRGSGAEVRAARAVRTEVLTTRESGAEVRDARVEEVEGLSAREDRRLGARGRAAVAWAAGLALGALGLLPVILRHGMGGAGFADFRDHFVYPHQLLVMSWGAGASIPGPDDALTFSLGVVGLALATLALVLPERSSPAEAQGDPGGARAARLAAAVLLVSFVFLASSPAAILWRALPFLARTLTYPWQLLLLAGPWLAWLAGLGGRKLLGLRPDVVGEDESQAAPLFAGLILLPLLAAYSMLTPVTTASPAPDAPLTTHGHHGAAPQADGGGQPADG